MVPFAKTERFIRRLERRANKTVENVTKEKRLDYKTIPAFLKAYLFYFPMHIWRCKKRFLLLFYLPRARHLQRQRLHWLEFIPRGSRCKRGGILILSNRRFQIATYLVKVAAGSVFSSSLCCHQSPPSARKGPGLFACKLLHRNIAACSTLLLLLQNPFAPPPRA